MIAYHARAMQQGRRARVGSGPPGSAGRLERLALRDWRAITALFGTSTLLESLAMGHLNAFTPLYLRDSLGLAASDVGPWTGYLAAITFGVAFPLAPFWGSLAERYSRKLMIVRSQYVEALGYALCGLAPDLAWLVVARIILGFTFGNIAIVIASQTLLTPDRKMGSAIAVTQAANPIAVSLGPPLGAALLPALGLRGLFYADAVACLLAALLVTFLMPEPAGRDAGTSVLARMRASITAVWRRPVLRLNFAAWYLTRGAMAVVDTYLPVRIGELVQPNPAPAIGLVLGVYGVLTTVATWATGRVLDRFGAVRLFWPGMLLAAASVLGLALAPSLGLLALFAWMRSVPVAFTSTGLYAHLAQALGREERAPIMSLTPAPRNLAMFSVPLAAAAVAVASSGGALLVGAAVYLAAAWVGRLMLADERGARRREREAPLAGTPP